MWPHFFRMGGSRQVSYWHDDAICLTELNVERFYELSGCFLQLPVWCIALPKNWALDIRMTP